MLILCMFMAWNDEHLHHNLVVMLHLFMVYSDECIHHDLAQILSAYTVSDVKYIYDNLEKYYQYILNRMIILFVTRGILNVNVNLLMISCRDYHRHVLNVNMNTFIIT